MLEVFILYINKIKALSFWGWAWSGISAYLIAVLSPLFPLFFPIVLLVGMDIFSGIKASQFEEKQRNVVSSKKWRDKMQLMIPFLIGLLSCRVTEHSIIGDGINIEILDIAIKNVLTTMWVGLFFINELISILENVSRLGYKSADPVINFLRIKKSEIEKAGEKNNDQK